MKQFLVVSPGPTAVFRGMLGEIPETVLDVTSASDQPFHITRFESNIEDKIGYSVETVEEGKHYKVKITNKAAKGTYMGLLRFFTDLQQKPEVIIRVNGAIEGEINVRPHVVLVGKYGAEQPTRSAKVEVRSTRNKPFHITKLAYDEKFLTVSQQALESETAYVLEIEPKMDALAPGARQQVNVVVQTDVDPEETNEVQVHIMNSVEHPPVTPGEKPAGEEAK